MYYPASSLDFKFALTLAREENENVKESVTHPSDLPDNTDWYLHADEKSGFGVTYDYELVAAFSCVKLRGNAILSAAVERGAEWLNHYDGYLTEFYASRGWVEYKRVDNWNANGPAVIYRSLVF